MYRSIADRSRRKTTMSIWPVWDLSGGGLSFPTSAACIDLPTLSPKDGRDAFSLFRLIPFEGVREMQNRCVTRALVIGLFILNYIQWDTPICNSPDSARMKSECAFGSVIAPQARLDSGLLEPVN